MDYFDGCEKLSVVILSHNYLTNMPNFAPLRNILSKVDLDDNLLHSCGKMCNETYPELHEVLLSRNLLQDFQFGMAVLWPKLLRLYLIKNKFTTLPDLTQFERKSNGRRIKRIHLFIDYNLFVCDKKMQWISEKKSSIPNGCCFAYGSYQILPDRAPTCHQPLFLQNETAWDLGRKQIML